MSTKLIIPQRPLPTMIDEFFKPWNQWLDDSRFVPAVRSLPAVNIKEQDDKYTVTLAAPGMKKEDFKIDLSGNMLSISSEKEEDKKTTEEKFTRREYSYQSFSRSFALPDDVTGDAIEARYEDGELTINIPRKKPATKATSTKHIEVK
jgi:HSP20 family protein